MLKRLSMRAKILIGVAIACALYVVFMPDSGETVEPARTASAASSGVSGGAASSSGESRSATSAHSSTGATAAAAGGTKRSGLIQAFYSLSHRVVKDTSAASLFAVHSWYVAPPPPPPAPVVVQAPPPPTAPPLPFAYMGTYQADGKQIYFLTSGDRVYDVKVGDQLDNTYSVDEVKAGQLLLTYIPLKIQQSLAVGESQ